ncbi:MAG: DNA mismatch repair endonuclease MutL [Methanotrichaceae archaeon]
MLDRDTVNKIAAGEVIERPVSVVKELIENSIDAGVTKILIEVTGGGRRLIRVTDDGCGMDQEDVVLAFQKHATSKISGSDDLDRINTLGFRGEALSSIANVAKSVEVQTKIRSRDLTASGTFLHIEDGEIAEMKEIGCPVGTSIEVRDLFYNVPARRKYLKSARAELARIVDLVTSYAIINYNVSFELFTGKRTAFKSVRSDNWDDCILRILGSDFARNMIPIKAKSNLIEIEGLVGKHTITRSSPNWIMIYVNGRAVRSRALVRAVAEAYRSLMLSGRHPIAIISLQIDPSQIDVNVHPAKKEVRFLREEDVADMLTESISQALQRTEEKESSPHQMKALQIRELDQECEENNTLPTEMRVKIAEGEVQKTLPLVAGGAIESKLKLDLSSSQKEIELKVLGQVLKLYIVAEGPEGLVLVDQHAAAERIRYEQLQKKQRDQTLAQELIVPANLELSPREEMMLEDWNDLLEEMGFEIVPFGGNAYNVRSVPTIGPRLESPEAVHDVLRDLFALGKVSARATTKDDVLKLLACRGSIKAGHELTWTEMQNLLRDLLACQNPKTCPHGRPTIVTISSAQLEKIFGRR